MLNSCVFIILQNRFRFFFAFIFRIFFFKYTLCSRMFSLLISVLCYSVVHSVIEFDSKNNFLHAHTHIYTAIETLFNYFTEFHSLKKFHLRCTCCVLQWSMCVHVCCYTVAISLIPYQENDYTSFAGSSLGHVHCICCAPSPDFCFFVLLKSPYRYTMYVYTGLRYFFASE